MTYTVAAHNIWFKLPAWKKKRDFKKSAKATITTYCEAKNDRVLLRSLCRKYDRELFFDNDDIGNPISYDPSKAEIIPGQTWVHLVHEDPKPIPGPARGYTAVGFRLLHTGRRVLVISVHPENGYAKGERNNPWGPKVNKHKDWSATQYWLDIVSFVAAQMSREYWDDIVISGDFNARMNNKNEWYYPARMLEALTRPSLTAGGIDHIITTRDSKSRVVGVLKMKGHTDHPILLARLS